jgi:hypothetical protein
MIVIELRDNRDIILLKFSVVAEDVLFSICR